MTDDSVSVSTDSDGGQATLTGGTTESVDVSLEPYEKAVYESLKETLDGETITGLDEHDPSPREMCGILPLGENPDTANIEGTIFSPDHSVWAHGPDEWITSPTEADAQVSQAIRKLTSEGVFKTSVTKRRGNEPMEMSVTVEEIE
jgi:hypothetical protein